MLIYGIEALMLKENINLIGLVIWSKFIVILLKIGLLQIDWEILRKYFCQSLTHEPI